MQSRPSRIRKLAEKHAAHTRKQKQKRLMALVRKEQKRPREYRIVAYDLETTRIQAGTPKPVYLTAYGDDGFFVSVGIRSIAHLSDILCDKFLTEEFHRTRYIGWNANKFDAYFVGAALLHRPEYILRPYLTNGNNLRGLRVSTGPVGAEHSWEFLDGMAMTGIQKSLSSFLKTFSPDYLKLDAPNWDEEEFDGRNEKHRRYAERDSEGLYHGMKKANAIVKEAFGTPLNPTIGNTGIKIFMAHVPEGTRVKPLTTQVDDIVRNYVMRGGFCFAQHKFAGKVWKYDINQAYAAAMRETMLPAGACMHLGRGTNANVPGIWAVEATAPMGNLIPFYFKDQRGNAVFSTTFIQSWITSIELAQLRAEGWQVKVYEGYWWDDSFTMKAYVDKLEDLRINAPGGPKSAQGEMVKAIGNNSYGKTVEVLNGLELVMALNRPEGYSHYQNHDETLQHLWFKLGDPAVRPYHQPHIGAFITAHVRMQVRRAALTNPRAWLYADTDCCIFSEPAKLDIDPSRYGAWKVECEGEFYRIITKKVYANEDASEKHAKGMNIKRLGAADFEAWYEGNAPVQNQVQRQNFLKVMTGEEMFIDRTRRGSK